MQVYPKLTEKLKKPFTKQAIEKHGIFRGTIMGIKRISRCRPGGGYGYDPVP